MGGLVLNSTSSSTALSQVLVVEITPPGIQSLQWKFYIIWTVFNFAFVPIGRLPPIADI